MKLFHKAVLFGTTALVLLVSQTSLAHAQKGGGSRGGSSGKSSGGMSNRGGGMIMSQGNAGRTVNAPSGKVNTIKQGAVQPLNKNVQSNMAKVPMQGVTKAPISVPSKVNTPQNLASTNAGVFKQASSKVKTAQTHPTALNANHFKHTSNGFNTWHFAGSKSYFCGSPWSQGQCFPGHHHHNHYCGFGFGWYNCWSYPRFNYCYFPSFYSCYTPCYDYCYTTPVYYTCQTPVVTTQQVVEVVQPAATVETVTITANATGETVQPSDLSYLTSSVIGR